MSVAPDYVRRSSQESRSSGQRRSSDARRPSDTRKLSDHRRPSELRHLSSDGVRLSEDRRPSDVRRISEDRRQSTSLRSPSETRRLSEGRRPSMIPKPPPPPPPEPQLSFTIPSLADGLELDCRIYVPTTGALRDPEAFVGLGTGKDGTMRGAVVAHPYAPTGGTYDDRIVIAMVEILIANGWICATFNFRGTKGGKGSTSWTAKPEIADLRSVVGMLTRFLTCLGRGRSGQDPRDIELILAGYSYGSMIVSQLGEMQPLLAPFDRPTPGSTAEKINELAAEYATKSLTIEKTGISADGLPAYDSVVAALPEAPQRIAPLVATGPLAPVRPAYLLVSPLLPPISGMLGLGVPTLPKGIMKFFKKAPAEAEEGSEVTLGMETQMFTRHPTFAIFGSNEHFTSAKKLSAWGDRMSELSPVRIPSVSAVRRRSSVTAGPRRASSVSNAPKEPMVLPRLFQYELVEDAGHFWRESSVEGIMRSKIRSWALGLE